MYGNKEYRFAIALLQFSRAWEELTQASMSLSDMDVSELYPFYLLDYEAIQPAVKQWCAHHASKILAHVPDQVYNPACVHCRYLKAGLGADGMCKGMHEMKCNNHPTIMFTPQAVLPFMYANDISTQGCSPEAIQLLYTRKVDEIYENKTLRK